MLPACSDERAAAVVDGTTITRASVNSEADQLLGNDAYIRALGAAVPASSVPSAQARDSMNARVLTRRIYLAVVFQEVARRNLSISADDQSVARQRIVAELGHDSESGQSDAKRGEDVLRSFPDSYQQTLIEREAHVVRLTRDLATSPVDDSAVAAYYADRLDDYTEVCARHILLPTREAADAARTRIEAGADFASVATEESTDTVTAHLGGDIGCASPSRYPQPFAEALRTLTVGVVSEPVETVLGFHVILVSKRTITPLSDVRAAIEAQLLEAQTRTFDDWLERTVRRASITVDPSFGHLDRSRPLPQVVP